MKARLNEAIDEVANWQHSPLPRRCQAWCSQPATSRHGGTATGTVVVG
ncbi:hypothetical protein RR42_s3060 [Cupriavidus basilensis]|uniref:Uncharacterized protein n=1 Tax=Cupriavidus basilensis TaxID=68895 RepID=A0A0C4YVW9_9BURK|nr:hypothetical protein RR42_s3060 [Cupriavidus basilensis]